MLDAGVRLGHHLRHRVAPDLVVARLFVLGGVVRGTIDLDQHVPSGKSQPFCCLPALFYPFFAFYATGPNPNWFVIAFP
jgi:hypothetical protein